MLENPVQIPVSSTDSSSVEAAVQPRQLLSAQQLAQLNQRADRPGTLH